MPGRWELGCRLRALAALALCALAIGAAAERAPSDAAVLAAGSDGGKGGSVGSSRPSANGQAITKVTLVFACHLDVGFHSPAYPEPGWDNNVLSRYFNDHYPNAMRLARLMRERNSTDRFVWMTHSWVASLFLDCPAKLGLRCPNASTVADFREAVARGDIVWHALPHNAQVELYDEDLLGYAVQFTHELDRAFGLPPKITMSQRDVPGLTRSAVPVLDYWRVKAISLGANGGCAPAGVPHNRPFWWRDPGSGRQLLMFYHPGGYSGWPVDSRAECVQAEGLDHALCTSWSGDNGGPPSLDQVLDTFLRVHSAFPHAQVTASGFDPFVQDLVEAAPSLNLPVFEGEIGDTWIHGAAQDPGKLSEYRALLRMRRASRERYEDPDFQRFSRLLLKLPEHTWGCDVKEYPGDWEHWSNADLQAKLADTGAGNPFNVALNSWVRQRSYTRWAVEELGNSSAGRAARAELAALEQGKVPPAPHAPNSGFQKVGLGMAPGSRQQPLLLQSDSWQLEMCRQTGAIVGLRFLGSSSSSGAGAGSVAAASGSAGTSSGGTPRPARLLRAAVGEVRSPQDAPTSQGKQQHQQQGAHSASGWASFDAPLALPVYSTYSEADYNIVWDTYAYQGHPTADSWFARDFGKPGATTHGGAKRADFLPRAEEVWWRREDGGDLTVVVKAVFAEEAVEKAGAPRRLWTEIRAPAGSPELSVDVMWEGKTPTRLPEGLWLRFVPRLEAVNSSSWLLYKLGRPVSPLDVVVNGSHSLHAVSDEGVSVDSADGATRLFIRTLDAAVVSPGKPQALPVVREQPDLTQGVAFLLSTNLWGTNYPSWIPYQKGDENMRFRFLLQLTQQGRQGGGGGGDARLQRGDAAAGRAAQA